VGGVAEVIAIDGRTVKVNEDDPSTPDHYADPGDDSLPCVGDFAAVETSDGEGCEQLVGYHDPKTEMKARPGEKRIYARSPEGVLVAEVYLQNDGTLVFKSLLAASGGELSIAPSGNITLNGVTVDPDGNLSVPGNISADGTVSAPEVAIAGMAHSTHVHQSSAPATPSGPPIAPPPEPP
jgi:hypothetical protein